MVKPQGILTEPNKVGQYPAGALAGGANMAIRSFGLVEQVNRWTNPYLSLPSTVVGGMYGLTDGPLMVLVGEYSFKTSWRINFYYQTGPSAVSTATILLGSPYIDYITADERTGMLLMRNRLIITGTGRSFAFDIYYSAGSGLTVKGPRNCGGYQPGIQDRNFGTTAEANGGVLAPNKHMSASVLSKQIHPDGYELSSPPSIPYDFANLSTTNAQIPSIWTVGSTVTISTTVGGVAYKNKIDLYRTRGQSTGYDSVGNNYIPVSTGSSFYAVTSVERQGSTTFFSEGVMDNALGEALVTNVSVSGASALPLPPVPSKTCARFRGHAFYANRLDPATITLLNPYFWGFMPAGAATPSAIRAFGIGTRATTGTGTSGSPTITAITSPQATGMKAGQNIVVKRTDTLATVLTGIVVSSTTTSVTADTNCSYSGAVNVETEDILEINGVRYPVKLSAQSFAYSLNLAGLNEVLDITAPGLEPQSSTAATGTGVYPGFVPTGGFTIRMRTNADISIRATNGGIWSPTLPAIEFAEAALVIKGTPQKNGYAWSENNEPENCPPSNYAFAGGGEIYKIIPTRDCLWFFCSDGLFRLSGNGGSVGDGYDWVLDPVDPSLIICNPNCCTVLREYIYAYTNRGLVRISSEGAVSELSDGRINPVDQGNGVTKVFLPNQTWTEVVDNGLNYSPWMVTDVVTDEVWLTHKNASDAKPKTWAYNVKTDSFTIRQPTTTPSAKVATFAIGFEFLRTVWGVFSGESVIAIAEQPTEFTEPMTLIFQPLYGAGAAAVHTQKHWQTCQLSFRTPQSRSRLVTLSSAVSAGSRVVQGVADDGVNPVPETVRVGYTIPRNFPAMSNACSLKISVDPNGADDPNGPVALEAVSLEYIEFTGQRVKR